MILKIDRLTSRDVNTSRGTSKSLSIQAGGMWYNAWSADWNSHWKVGSQIEIEESQIEVTEKNGKTYRNIKAPKDGGKKQQPPAKNSETEERILKGVTELWKAVSQLRKEVGELREEVKSMRNEVGAIPL